MNIAEQIKASLASGHMDYSELLEQADKVGDNYENDYDAETSLFEFADGSVCMFLGVEQDIMTYGSK